MSVDGGGASGGSEGVVVAVILIVFRLIFLLADSDLRGIFFIFILIGLSLALVLEVMLLLFFGGDGLFLIVLASIFLVDVLGLLSILGHPGRNDTTAHTSQSIISSRHRSMELWEKTHSSSKAIDSTAPLNSAMF